MKLANLFFGLLLLAGVMNVTHAAVEEKNGFEHQTEAEFEAWCAQGTRALERARNTAAGQVAYGQFQSAAQTLIHALRSGVARPDQLSWLQLAMILAVSKQQLMHLKEFMI
jgi:hypothetical protein